MAIAVRGICGWEVKYNPESSAAAVVVVLWMAGVAHLLP